MNFAQPKSPIKHIQFSKGEKKLTKELNNIPQTAVGSDLASPHSSVPSVLPKVAILMGAYQGQPYIAEQLDSFEAQTHPHWEVFASDDGSNDNTLPILQQYQQKWGASRLQVLKGPQKGFAANFLSLACHKAITADYYAYSDQDDIWEADKLAQALAWLDTVPPQLPALYCSRTRLVDAHNQEIGLSPLFTQLPCFSNALVQSIAGGNTMVFNNAARALLMKAGEQIPVITHDWWTYLVVSGCGGRIYYHTYPSLRYRQHASNLIGMNVGWRASLLRIKKLLNGRFRAWNEANMTALESIKDQMTAENQRKLEIFINARQKSLIPRLLGFKKASVHRQDFLENLGLVVAAICNKI